MGACGGKLTEEERRAVEANREIEKELAKMKKNMAKEVKLLLLGTGASGKSTVAKQMQIIYLKGFGSKEKEEYKKLIITNVVENSQALVKGARKLNIALDNAKLADEVMTWEPTEPDFAWNPEMLNKVKTLWRDDSGIKKAFKRQNEFQLNDSALHFFDKLDKYENMSSYNVEEEDILRVRKKTTGIVEIDFTVGELHFRMVDVGGQRNERKKWIHCFEDVTAILFVGALSEYDQVLEEDETTNRMRESLHLFEETINNEWFSATPIILFLNKNDIFEAKATKVDMGEYIEEYKGGKDVEAARKFIKNAYAEKNHSSKNERDFYIHCTTATDTKNILTVFDAVQDIFLSAALDEFNL